MNHGISASRALVIALVAAGTVALLWPWPTSERWDIPTDPEMVAGKRAYLEAIEATSKRATGARPNVLLLVADDLGRYDVSRYGHTPGSTPHIDALAEQGVRFSDAYASAPICAPSRAALLTGRVQNRFGFESQPMQRYVRNLGEFLGFRYLIDTDEMQPFLIGSYPNAEQRSRQGLPPSEITLGDVFRAAGYDTAILGKWHLGYASANHPSAFGFDQQYGFMEAFTLYADEADAEVVNHHHDLFWEEHIWDMQRSGPSAITRNGVEVSEDRYLTDAIVAETEAFIASAREHDRPFFAYVPFSAPHTPFQARREDVDAIAREAAPADENHRVYLAMIRRLDWAVGELQRFLEASGQLDDTLIVFTSDNGGAAYTGATDNGPLRGGKFTQFEGGLEVPLFIRWPGRLPPRVVDDPVMLTDLFATLLSVLDVPLADERAYDSADLLAAELAPRPLFWRSDFNRAVRDGRWKLLNDTRDGTVLLFDLEQDLGERHDVAAANEAKVAELMRALDAWETELQPPSWPRVMNYLYLDDGGSYWFAI